MISISPRGDICICFATDDNYAPHLRVTVNSLICNRNCELSYDIIVLHAGLSAASKSLIASVAADEQRISIRFIDIAEMADSLQYDVGAYLSVATNYRLLLLSELFSEYDRAIYLDSDVIVETNIAELYHTDMEGKLIAAVEDFGFRQLSLAKRAIFIDGKIPYSADKYKTDALGMQHPEDYVNAGVILFDLKRCRHFITYEEITNILHRKKFHFNDQDTLNIAFDGQVQMLDSVWNYQNNIDVLCQRRPAVYEPLYNDLIRSDPKIIHFVSSYKPWSFAVALDEHYHKYE